MVGVVVKQHYRPRADLRCHPLANAVRRGTVLPVEAINIRNKSNILISLVQFASVCYNTDGISKLNHQFHAFLIKEITTMNYKYLLNTSNNKLHIEHGCSYAEDNHIKYMIFDSEDEVKKYTNGKFNWCKMCLYYEQNPDELTEKAYQVRINAEKETLQLKQAKKKNIKMRVILSSIAIIIVAIIIAYTSISNSIKTNDYINELFDEYGNHTYDYYCYLEDKSSFKDKLIKRIEITENHIELINLAKNLNELHDEDDELKGIISNQFKKISQNYNLLDELKLYADLEKCHPSNTKDECIYGNVNDIMPRDELISKIKQNLTLAKYEKNNGYYDNYDLETKEGKGEYNVTTHSYKPFPLGDFLIERETITNTYTGTKVLEDEYSLHYKGEKVRLDSSIDINEFCIMFDSFAKTDSNIKLEVYFNLDVNNPIIVLVYDKHYLFTSQGRILYERYY